MVGRAECSCGRRAPASLVCATLECHSSAVLRPAGRVLTPVLGTPPQPDPQSVLRPALTAAGLQAERAAHAVPATGAVQLVRQGGTLDLSHISSCRVLGSACRSAVTARCGLLSHACLLRLPQGGGQSLPRHFLGESQHASPLGADATGPASVAGGGPSAPAALPPCRPVRRTSPFCPLFCSFSTKQTRSCQQIW